MAWSGINAAIYGLKKAMAVHFLVFLPLPPHAPDGKNHSEQEPDHKPSGQHSVEQEQRNRC